MCDRGESFEDISAVEPRIRNLDPFWATRLWQKLIREVTSNVRVCRQRHFLKNYDNVFNGEDLVNVVLNYLKQCPEIDVNRIDRSNAIKVCQYLMEKRLFDNVVSKSNLKFEDGSNKFYRFIEDEVEVISNENTDENEMSRINIEDNKENFISPEIKNASMLQVESVKRSNFKPCLTRRSLRFKTPLKIVRETKPSPVRIAKRSTRDTDQEVAFLEFRETALAILLQLVDIPVLESVLNVPPDLLELAEAPQPFVLENDFTPRKMKPFNFHFHGPLFELPWIHAASECLGGGYPPGLANLWSVQACKVLCYKAVSEWFSCSVESLIPGEYFSLSIAIVNLIKEGKCRRAVCALQLLVFHLPIKRRNQLQKLLNFLHIVVEDLFVNVDKKVTNYEAVLRDFLPVIFRHPLVSSEPQKILFDFLLFNSSSLFAIPPILCNRQKINLWLCTTVPSECLETPAGDYTKQSLADLAAFVVDSTEIKLAEKKAWLKKFKKNHTDVYDFCNFTE